MKEALKLALEMVQTKMFAHAEMYLKEALAQPTSGDYALGYAEGFNDACKPQPAQEPTGMLHIDRLDKWLDASLKERKAQRTWVSLTDEEIQVVAKQARSKDHAVTLTNKLLKENNT